MGKLRILFPRRTANTARRDVPHTFVATGLVRHRQVRSVEGVVEELVSGTPNGNKVQGLLRHFRPVKRKSLKKHRVPLYRWVLLFPLVGTTAGGRKPFQLTVNGLDATGTAIGGLSDELKSSPVWVNSLVSGLTSAPSYSYPDDGYVIAEFERDYFVTFGSVDWNKPVLSARIGGVDAANVTTEVGTSGMVGWWAEFTDLASNPGPGDTELIVSNADGVNILAVEIDEDMSSDRFGDLDFSDDPPP